MTSGDFISALKTLGSAERTKLGLVKSSEKVLRAHLKLEKTRSGKTRSAGYFRKRAEAT
jgi:hypothetical protein